MWVIHYTKKKLAKKLAWRKIDKNQFLELVNKGFTREDLDYELGDLTKSGPTYYTAHKVTLNPTLKTTPLRFVLNSSWKFKG